MRLRAWARCLLLLGMCWAPSVALARAPILPGLSWVRLPGAESCISTIALAQRVEDKLSRPVFVPTSAAEVTIEGFVKPREGGGFATHLAVVALDGRVLGTRQFETNSPDCGEIEEALTLVIAVTLNPDSALAGFSMLSPEMQAELDRLLSGDVVPSTTAPPVAVVPVPNAKPAVDDGSGADVRPEFAIPEYGIRLEAAVLGGAGMMPTPSVGLELGVAFLPRSWFPILVTLQGFAPRTLAAPNRENGETDFTVGRVAALMCPGQRTGVITVDGCIGFDAGVMRVKTRLYRFNDDLWRPVFDLALQTNLRFRLGGGWSLRGALSIGAPVTRLSVVARLREGEKEELFTVSPVTLALHLGAGVVL